jgi:ABC-type glycerol-3-phosphate transport system substrate-binding protein
MGKAKALAVLGMALGLAALPGCSGSSGDSSASGKDATISFLTFETPALDASFWETSIAAAEAEVPGVTIERLTSPDADRNAYAKQLQASGQLPDVLASINAKDFIGADLLSEFSPEWLEENFLVPDAASIEGKTYVPPTGAQILPLVYFNKTIFADQGIEVPNTGEQFKAAVVKLRAAGITPIELAGGEPWSAAMPLTALVSADVLGPNPDWIQQRYADSVKFTDADFKSAVDKQAELIELGAYHENALGVKYADANTEFLGGKAAMYIMGSWLNGLITADVADQFGAFPFPTDNGDIVIPFNVGGSTSVNSKSEHAAQAMDFAKAWSLAPDNIKVLVETDGLYPLLKGVTIESMGAKVTSLYNDTYTYVTDQNNKVASFGWVNNDDQLPPGVPDAFYAMSQKMFTDDDIDAQLAALDEDWDKATQ